MGTLPLSTHARNAAHAALRASRGDAPCSTMALIATRWLGQSVPTTGLHGESGLDNWMVLEYTVHRIGNSTRCTGRGTRNNEEATIVGSHHPPAIKVGAGVFVL